MSAVLENTEQEIKDLQGALIETAAIEDDGYGEQVVVLRVRYRADLRVNGSQHGEYQVWQDPEGNGPGFLALTGTGRG